MQVVQMSSGAAAAVFALFAVFFLIGGAILSLSLTPLADEVDEAVRAGADSSDAASRCLQKTEQLAALLWGAGSAIYAVIGSAILMRTALGFGYFLVSALVAAFPSVIWAYA